ncbi:AI-2E family transporter [Thermococcus sp.]
MRAETIVWIVISFLILFLTWETIKPVLTPVIFALTIAYIFYPWHKNLAEKIGERNSGLVLTSLLAILLMLFVLGFALWVNGVKSYLALYLDVFFKWLLNQNLPPSLYDVLQRVANDILRRFEDYLQAYTYSLPTLTLQVFVLIFTFYGVLLNAKAIEKEIYEILPSEKRDLALRLIRKGEETLNMLLRVWLAFSVIKGTSLALAFLIFGIANVSGAIAAGIFTLILELLPVVGGWMIWLAGTVYLFQGGKTLLAILFALYGFFLVSPIPDYLLRQKITPSKIGVNGIIALVGIFGGLFAFGAVGIIIGPVTLGLVATLIEEWKTITEKER